MIYTSRSCDQLVAGTAFFMVLSGIVFVFI